MERKKTIQELISALETLRIQEADLTAQLKQALAGPQDTAQEAVKTTKREEKRSSTHIAFTSQRRQNLDQKQAP